MNPCEYAAFVASISCTIFKTCSKEEITILIANLNILSNNLSSMLVQDELCNKATDSDGGIPTEIVLTQN